MGGYIMQIQHFSVNDGEGIRTNLFLAGCPLRCPWCANPEGQTLCNPMTRWAETEEILQEVRRQAIFYRFSGGGVTFTGGEATAQPEFLAELADTLYDEGYSLALESCGWFDFHRLRPTLEKMDLIFLDLKHPDPEEHRRLTGQDNGLILENMEKTARQGIPLVVRIPVILGINGTDDVLAKAFALIRKKAPGASLELLPYHRFGEEKYKELGLPLPDPAFGIPTREQMARWEDQAKAMGISVVSYR